MIYLIYFLQILLHQVEGKAEKCQKSLILKQEFKAAIQSTQFLYKTRLFAGQAELLLKSLENSASFLACYLLFIRRQKLNFVYQSVAYERKNGYHEIWVTFDNAVTSDMVFTAYHL